MASFHRFVDPTYYLFPGESFPTVPGGAGTVGLHTYDRVNVDSGGIGAGNSANAGGQAGAGANEFTYFVAFGNDGTSQNVNRGFRAVFESLDTLDDVIRTSTPRRAEQSAVSPAANEVVLTGEAYVSDNPATPVGELFYVVETATGRPMYNGTTRVVVTDVDTGVGPSIIGSTWATNPRVLFNVVVNKPYTLYYGTRTSLGRVTEIEPGAWWTPYMAAFAAANSGEAQALHGIDERYRRSADLTDGAAITGPGEGAVFTRDGQAMTALMPNTVDYTVTRPSDGYGAAYLATPQTFGLNAVNNSGGDIGFLGLTGFVGVPSDADELSSGSSNRALAAQFIPRDIQAATLRGETTLSYIPKNAPATLNPSGAGATLVELDAPYYFQTGGRSAVRQRRDCLKVTFGDGTSQLFVMTYLPPGNPDRAELSTPTNQFPVFAADTAVTVEWLSLHVSFGGMAYSGQFEQYALQLCSTERMIDAGSDFGSAAGIELIGRGMGVGRTTADRMLVMGYTDLGTFQRHDTLSMYASGTIDTGVGSNGTGYIRHALCQRTETIVSNVASETITFNPAHTQFTGLQGEGASIIRLVRNFVGLKSLTINADLSGFQAGMLIELIVEEPGGGGGFVSWDPAFRFSQGGDEQLASSAVGIVTRWRGTYTGNEILMERSDYEAP